MNAQDFLNALEKYGKDKCYIYALRGKTPIVLAGYPPVSIGTIEQGEIDKLIDAGHIRRGQTPIPRYYHISLWDNDKE